MGDSHLCKQTGFVSEQKFCDKTICWGDVKTLMFKNIGHNFWGHGSKMKIFTNLTQKILVLPTLGINERQKYFQNFNLYFIK